MLIKGENKLYSHGDCVRRRSSIDVFGSNFICRFLPFYFVCDMMRTCDSSIMLKRLALADRDRMFQSTSTQIIELWLFSILQSGNTISVELRFRYSSSSIRLIIITIAIDNFMPSPTHSDTAKEICISECRSIRTMHSLPDSPFFPLVWISEKYVPSRQRSVNMIARTF